MNNGKKLQDLRGQNHCKNVGLVKQLVIYHYFHGLKLSYLFLFQRILSKKKVNVKKNMLTITLAATSLTTNPPSFQEEKNSQKLKIVKSSL